MWWSILGRLDCIDSSGIQVLLVYLRLCGERGRRFFAADPRARVRRLLEMVDLQKRLPVAGSVEAACAQIPEGLPEAV